MPEIVPINDGGWYRQEKIYNSEDCSLGNLGKIDLGSQSIFSSHRSGWGYAIDALGSLHNPRGVLFDGFLEKNFAWLYKNNVSTGRIPYTRPWVGFFHNPMNVPDWFFSSYSLRNIIDSRPFRESLSNCLGLYTLSRNLSDELSRELGVPICNLIHPTEVPELTFSLKKFIENQSKKIVSIGWWLRKLNSIYNLPLSDSSGYTKVRLLTYDKEHPRKTIDKLMITERRETMSFMNGSTPSEYENNTEDMSRLSNENYDKLLSENIVFLDLYDSSANNAVIECIARTTPILINKLPSTLEYLGEDYPFFFESLDEAASKALDLDLVRKTHEYLKACDTRKKLSQEYFARSFEESDIYKSL